jgi:membrane protein
MASTRIAPSRNLSSEAWQLASRRALHGFVRHRGLDSAATLAFFAALVVFPASLAIVSVFALSDSKKGHAQTDILTIIGSVTPHDTVSAIRAPLAQLFSLPNPGYALVIGLVLTLWAMSGYLTAVGRAINAAYEVQEGRQWFVLRITMVLISAVIVAAMAVMFVLLIGTPTVARVVAHNIGAPSWLVVVWDIAKWPLLAAIAVFIVAILYYYSPNVRHLRIRWVTWGAIAAIVAWALTSLGFGIYVLNVSHYNKIYGWLGGGIILLLWLFLSNWVVVFGAEVDAEIVRVRQLEAGIVAEESVQLPLRSTYRNLRLARHLAEDVARGKALREDANGIADREAGD